MNDLERCDLCKHWRCLPAPSRSAMVRVLTQLDLFFEDETIREQASRAKNLGVCKMFGLNDSKQLHPDSGLIVTRTGTGEATIVTTSDFGCKRFEERK